MSLLDFDERADRKSRWDISATHCARFYVRGHKPALDRSLEIMSADIILDHLRFLQEGGIRIYEKRSSLERGPSWFYVRGHKAADRRPQDQIMSADIISDRIGLLDLDDRADLSVKWGASAIVSSRFYVRGHKPAVDQPLGIMSADIILEHLRILREGGARMSEKRSSLDCGPSKFMSADIKQPIGGRRIKLCPRT